MRFLCKAETKNPLQMPIYKGFKRVPGAGLEPARPLLDTGF